MGESQNEEDLGEGESPRVNLNIFPIDEGPRCGQIKSFDMHPSLLYSHSKVDKYNR